MLLLSQDNLILLTVAEIVVKTLNYIHLSPSIDLPIYINAFMYACIYVCMYRYMYVCMHARMCVFGNLALHLSHVTWTTSSPS